MAILNIIIKYAAIFVAAVFAILFVLKTIRDVFKKNE